ncbi:MAG: hypothetical protein WA990_11815 [Rubrobacteraceae bacterium]
MDHVLSTLLAGRDRGGRRQLICSAAAVEKAYARVREHAPNHRSSDAGVDFEELFHSLQSRRQHALPPRPTLVRVLASLEYRFFWVACSSGRAWATLMALADYERTTQTGLEQELLAALYRELGPAFDVSLCWPPGDCDASEAGELVEELEDRLASLMAVGYRCGREALVFYQGHADKEAYVGGFVEGCLERIGERAPEEACFLRDSWDNGGCEGSEVLLNLLKEECEIRPGRFGDPPCSSR